MSSSHNAQRPTESPLTLVKDGVQPVVNYGVSVRLVPTADSIIEQLKYAGLVNSAKSVQLLLLPRNTLRADYASRVDFRVSRAGKQICYLSVGRNLGGLRSRTEAFAKNCPAIACRPLFWRRVDGWDYFATEYFEGEKLDSALLNGRISAAQVEKILGDVVGALEQTTRDSTIQAVERELRQLFVAAARLPVFGDIDRVLLEGVIFSFIRAGALSVAPRTRWTNGDFIPQNLLVAPDGEVRVIDYEFATRTHFFSADGWRWRRFSRLTAELRESTRLSDNRALGRWFEALCILQHMIALHQVHPASIAMDESRICARELMELVTVAHSGFRSEALLRVVASAPSVEVPPRTPERKVQLFWSSTGRFSEADSQSLAYGAIGDGVARFDLHGLTGPIFLRFDPINAPGLLEITAIRVRIAPQREPLLSLTESGGWDQIKLAADLLRLPDSPFLNLVSLGDDPVLLLPTIHVPEHATVIIVEVWMRYSADLRSLPHIFSPLLKAPAIAVSQLATQAARLEAEGHGLRQQYDSLRPSAEEAQALAGKGADEQARATERIVQLETERQGLSEKLEVLQRTLDQAETRAAKGADEQARATERIVQLETERQGLSEKLEVLQRTLDQAETLAAQGADEQVRAAERIAQLEVDVQRLKQQVDAHQRAADQAQALVVQRSDELTEARTQLQVLAEQFSSEQAKAAERITQLEAEGHGLKQQVDAHQGAAAQAQALVTQLSDELMEARTSLQALAEQIALEKEKSAERIAQLEKQGQILCQQVEAHQSATSHAQAVVAQQSDELTEARAHLQALKQRITVEQTQAVERIAQLETEGRELRRQIEEFRLAADAAAARIAAFEAAQVHIRREQQLLHSRSHDAENARQAAATATRRLELLAKRIGDLEGYSAVAVRNCELAQGQLIEQRRKLESIQAELAHVRHERHLAHLDGVALREAVARLENELAYVRHERHMAHLDGLALREALVQRERQLADLDDALVEAKRQHLELGLSLEHRLGDLRRQLTEAEAARLAAAGRCERITQSFSWRCTSPLRWLRRLLIDPT